MNWLPCSRSVLDFRRVCLYQTSVSLVKVFSQEAEGIPLRAQRQAEHTDGEWGFALWFQAELTCQRVVDANQEAFLDGYLVLLLVWIAQNVPPAVIKGLIGTVKADVRRSVAELLDEKAQASGDVQERDIMFHSQCAVGSNGNLEYLVYDQNISFLGWLRLDIYPFGWRAGRKTKAQG